MKHRKMKLPALLLAILLVCGIATAFATTAPEGAAQEAPAADAADYSTYEPFGLVYAGDAGDTYRTNYTYGGQSVRFFYDPVAGASFTNLAGVVDVEAVYEDGRLTGLRECSPEDYDRRTERIERAFGVAATSAPGNAAQDMAVEVAGKASEGDDWLKEYDSLGVTRNAESGKWLYNGTPIRALIDPEAGTVFRSDDGTVRLVALRNDAGEAYALEELTDAEASQLMLAMSPQGASTTMEAGPLPGDAEMTEAALTRLAANHPEMAAWARACYPDTVWWTVEGYAARMEERQRTLCSEEGHVIGWNSDGAVTVTPETIEAARAEDEEVLSLLAGGWLISKSIGGDENYHTRIDPAEWESIRSEEYELSITLNDGTEAHFGPFDTAEALLEAFSPFALEQIAAGNLDEIEAQEILADCQGMI